MEAFREYLELFAYFGRGGAVRLSREEFDALDAEWRVLVLRLEEGTLDVAGSRRLVELKQLLLRDKP